MSHTCHHLGFARNVGGSCYCDVAIYALFFRPDRYIDEQILHSRRHERFLDSRPHIYTIIAHIQRELNKVYESIQHGENFDMSTVRVGLSYYLIIKMAYNMFQTPPDQRWVEYRNGMRDTIAFLEYQPEYAEPDAREALLVQMFVEINMEVHEVRELIANIMSVHQKYHLQMMFTNQQLAPVDLYSVFIDIFDLSTEEIRMRVNIECLDDETNEWKEGTVSESSTILIPLSGQMLIEPISLERLFEMYEVQPTMDLRSITGGGPCRELMARRELVQAPMLIIYVQKDETGKREAVYPVDTLTTKQGNLLQLSALILHTGTLEAGHYQVYIHCSDGWYLYDDTASHLQLITSQHPSMELPKYEQISQDTIYYVYVSR